MQSGSNSLKKGCVMNAEWYIANSLKKGLCYECRVVVTVSHYILLH